MARIGSFLANGIPQENGQAHIRSCESQRIHLGFVTDLSEKERHERCEEGAPANERRAAVIELVRFQCPQRHNDHARADHDVQRCRIEKPAKPCADEPCCQVVGNGGAQDAGEDSPGVTLAGRQHQRKKLSPVTRLGERDSTE
jgi:hypothetical protein